MSEPTVLDFLNKDFTNTELTNALKILQEFKNSHNYFEDLSPPLIAWGKLEQLEEFLEYRVNKTSLQDDTLEYIKQMNFKLEDTTNE